MSTDGNSKSCLNYEDLLFYVPISIEHTVLPEPPNSGIHNEPPLRTMGPTKMVKSQKPTHRAKEGEQRKAGSRDVKKNQHRTENAFRIL